MANSPKPKDMNIDFLTFEFSDGSQILEKINPDAEYATLVRLLKEEIDDLKKENRRLAQQTYIIGKQVVCNFTKQQTYMKNMAIRELNKMIFDIHFNTIKTSVEIAVDQYRDIMLAKSEHDDFQIVIATMFIEIFMGISLRYFIKHINKVAKEGRIALSGKNIEKNLKLKLASVASKRSKAKRAMDETKQALKSQQTRQALEKERKKFLESIDDFVQNDYSAPTVSIYTRIKNKLTQVSRFIVDYQKNIFTANKAMLRAQKEILNHDLHILSLSAEELMTSKILTVDTVNNLAVVADKFAKNIPKISHLQDKKEEDNSGQDTTSINGKNWVSRSISFATRFKEEYYKVIMNSRYQVNKALVEDITSEALLFEDTYSIDKRDDTSYVHIIQESMDYLQNNINPDQLIDRYSSDCLLVMLAATVLKKGSYLEPAMIGGPFEKSLMIHNIARVEYDYIDLPPSIIEDLCNTLYVIDEGTLGVDSKTKVDLPGNNITFSQMAKRSNPKKLLLNELKRIQKNPDIIKDKLSKALNTINQL